MYRLTENVYALDDKGVLRLTERVPVEPEAIMQIGARMYVVMDQDTAVEITDDLAGDDSKFTLTQHEDPMHENCGPCEAGLPEDTHSAPETKLKTVAKAILIVLLATTAAALMRMC